MKMYFKFLFVLVAFTVAFSLTIKYFERPVQEVCVPLHVKLNSVFYETVREDTIKNSDYPVKRIYYIERTVK